FRAVIRRAARLVPLLWSAAHSRRPADQKTISDVDGRYGFALTCTRHFGGVLVSEMRRNQAVGTAATLATNQIKKRKVPCICPGSGIEGETHRRVHIDVNLVEWNLSRIEGVDAVSHGIFCCEFDVATISLACPFEEIDGK